MDIKLKKSKMIIGVISWFAGVVILISNLFGFALEAAVYSDIGRQVKEVLDSNYQNTNNFRYYISDIVNEFLSMAVIEDTYNDQDVNSQTAEQALKPGMEKALEYEISDMTKQDAEIYHKNMEKNRNILYNISVNGKVLYTNEESLNLYGNDFVLPEGYNFMLYFDGEKAHVKQDGRDINIYGDGYYKGSYGDFPENGWNIPGYINYPSDESLRDVRIYLAAAKTPSISINYNAEGNKNYSTGLYDIQQNLYHMGEVYTNWMHSMMIGAILFIIGLFLRKYRYEAIRSFAAVTGRWWYELKLLPVLAILYSILFLIIVAVSVMYWNGSGILSDLRNIIYGYEYGFSYGGLFFIYFIISFGIMFVFINDARFNKQPWKNSLTGKIFRLFNTAMLKLTFSKRMVKYQTWSFIVCAAGGILVLLCGILYYKGYIGQFFNSPVQACIIAGSVLFGIVMLCQLLYAVRVRLMVQDVDILAEQIKSVHEGKITGGNELVKMSEESGLLEILKDFNDIKTGMNKAVEKQMKSDRMKVELIANVSHDIKTPLTSIISYVELLKQEKELPVHVREYVEILESKSQRLKSMVQDVFEVSKAASGELPVEMEKLDLGKLLRQTIADMGEQIDNCSVIIKPEIPDEAVMICADGNRLYRVFQNLIQNALKYSLDGSRVYITVERDGNFAVASIKNTSNDELQGNVDFTERFIRGDSSRSDGGSGLGLSIARSFTEACGGSFKVEIIADLFVVTVSFPNGS